MGLEAFSLEVKSSLVAGGGTGVGLGISKASIEAGARLEITGRRENILKDAITKLGSMAYYRVDIITEKEKIPQLI